MEDDSTWFWILAAIGFWYFFLRGQPQYAYAATPASFDMPTPDFNGPQMAPALPNAQVVGGGPFPGFLIGESPIINIQAGGRC